MKDYSGYGEFFENVQVQVFGMFSLGFAFFGVNLGNFSKCTDIMGFIFKIVVYILVVFEIDWLLVGVGFRTIEAGILVAGCMAVINIFIKPLIQTLAFPVTLMTLGLFPLVLNTIFIIIVSHFVKGFVIYGDFIFYFIWAFAFGFLLTVATVIVEQITGWNLPN